MARTIEWCLGSRKVFGAPECVGTGMGLRGMAQDCTSVWRARVSYSMSAQIRQERAAYYRILEETQKGPLDITPWMKWFLGCLGSAIDGARNALSAILSKARFWEQIQAFPLNDRQRLVLNRLLDGFEGKLTTSKYAKLAKCSQDTALRDILPLVERGILHRNPEGGRSTSYVIAEEPGRRHT
jgi:Fic family protein